MVESRFGYASAHVQKSPIHNVWREYKLSLDSKLRKDIIEYYLPYAKQISIKVHNRLQFGFELEDLFQDAVIGLIRAVDKYDVDRGVEFGIYSNKFIRGAIFDGLREREIVPRVIRERITLINRCKQSFFEKNGRAPDEFELCEKSGYSVGQYNQMMATFAKAPLKRVYFCCSHKYGESGDQSFVHLAGKLKSLSSDASDPLEKIANEETSDFIKKGLTRREILALNLTLGENLDREAIAEVLGISVSSFYKLQNNILGRIRASLANLQVA